MLYIILIVQSILEDNEFIDLPKLFYDISRIYPPEINISIPVEFEIDIDPNHSLMED